MPVRRRQPGRPHFIQEWAEYRGFKNQTELAHALGIDKSVVSRWYKGTSPYPDSQERLAELFNCEPESLFRHPDDDWLTRFFQDRSRDEIEKMKQVLELSFPKRTGTDG